MSDMSTPSQQNVDDNAVKEDALPQLERIQRRRRYFLVLFAFLYTFFFSGAFFGWGPMQLLLEESGAFSSKCTPEEKEARIVCSSQSATLVRIHFIGQMSQFVSPILGQIVDHYGPVLLSYLMGIFGCSGVALLLLAVETRIDWLLYVAFLGIAFSTWMGALLAVRTGMIFQGRTRSRVLFTINSLFDAGSITYLGLWGLAQSFDWSLSAVTGLYLGLAVVCYGGVCYCWTVVVPEPELLGMDSAKPIPSDESQTADKVNGMDDLDGTPCRLHPEKSQEMGNEQGLEAEKSRTFRVEGEGEESSPPCHPHDTTDYVLVADRTQWQQLISRPFLLYISYTTIMITANQWTLTTTRDFLAALGDDEVDNKYLTIFTFLLPASLAAVPFTDWIHDKYGFHGGFQTINILALGYSLVRLLSKDLNVQILGFLFFSFFRCFLFGVTFSVFPILHSPDVVGKAMGVTFAAAGITAFINIPLSTIAIEQQDGDFFLPNLMYTILILPCIYLSWSLTEVINQEGRIRKKRQQSFN